MTCSHLSSEDAGRWAGIGVGVARMVHRVRVVMLIRSVTPERDTKRYFINPTEGLQLIPRSGG